MSNMKRKIPAIGKCFDHLGGKLAPILFNRLLEMNWITPKEGKKTVFEPTKIGKDKLKKIFNVDISKLNDSY